jgi:hypothetical protein
MTTLQAAEHAHQKAVLEGLRAFDDLTLQVNVPLRHAGVIADIIARTTNKQIVIEAAAVDASPDPTAALRMARRKVAHIKRAAGAEYAFVVVPDGTTTTAEDVIMLTGLANAIQTVLDAPVFRGAIADLGEDTDAPLVYAAMPYKLGFDDAYFLGVVDAALKAGMVVDRIDNVEAEERIEAGIQSAATVVADLTGTDEHVMSQLNRAQAEQKPIIPICNSGQQALPEDISAEETIFYSSAEIDNLRQSLTQKLTDMTGSA